MGKLFYLWHAAYYLIESGVCLLASILTDMESAGQDHTQLGGEDVTIFIRYVKVFPPLLSKISRRWPNVVQHASAIDTVSLSVLEALQDWSSGGTVASTEFEEMKLQVKKFSPFALFPVDTIIADDSAGATATDIYLGVGDQMFSTDSVEQFSHQGFPIPAMEDTNPGWESTQLALQSNPPIFPSLDDLDIGGTLEWDFAGMDYEDILTGFLGG